MGFEPVLERLQVFRMIFPFVLTVLLYCIRTTTVSLYSVDPGHYSHSSNIRVDITSFDIFKQFSDKQIVGIAEALIFERSTATAWPQTLVDILEHPIDILEHASPSL